MQHSRLRRAELKDKEVLNNLMQFYFYDFSEFIDAFVDDDGLFSKYHYLEYYFNEEGRFPYLIEKEGKLAGFVLVREVTEESKRYWSVAEFFIMKKFRRSGLGEWAAHQVFDRHIGDWEVRQIEKNIPAQIFWRKVIGRYKTDFKERVEEDRVVQSFTNGK
jgi:predicted acetyltransferase